MMKDEYQQAILSLKQYEKIYPVSYSLVQCMDGNCYEGRSHTDSEMLSKQIAEKMIFLCDDKNDFIADIQRLIVKFAPGQEKDSFNTFILQITQSLDTIKKFGWSQEREDSLNGILGKFYEELTKVKTSLNETKYLPYSKEISSSSEMLSYRADHLRMYQDKCVHSHCGCMGHGNPALGIMRGALNVINFGSDLSGPLKTVKEFCSEIQLRVNDCCGMLETLKNMEPAKNVDEALKQLDRLSDGWKELIEFIES